MQDDLEKLPPELTEEEWDATRGKGLGGTDVAAIVGVHPWRSPLDVYAAKLGLVDRPEANANMRFGTAMESFALDEYGLATQQKVVKLGRRIFVHPDIEIWRGCPDGLVPAGPGVEAKTVSWSQARHWGEEGTDEVPDWYRVQVEWYMPLLRRDVFDFAVWFAGVRFSIYRVEREQALLDALADSAQRFWRDHILTQRPPPLDASRGAEAYLKAMFPRELVAARETTASEEQLLMDLWAARLRTKMQQEVEDTLENRVKAIIGEAAGIESPSHCALWKRTKDSVKVDWETIARKLKPPARLIQDYSEPKPGVRRFTINERS
jgi:putative phage-type endonuclease